ncbi:MAG TPA: hypothetical protein VFD41_08275 [Actinomycetales bacterium]|nr:hypothetical protein [Actinomycetales bacterium]
MSETVDPPVEHTGDEAVDAALETLGRLGPETPLDRHVAVLDEVHQALQHRLTATQG